MRCVAEIIDQAGKEPVRHELMANLPASLESAERLWIICGVYLVLLLAGLVVDLILAGRLLKAQRLTGAGGVDWAGRVECLKSRPWTWREAGLIMAILLTAQLVMKVFYGVLVEYTSMGNDLLAAGCQGIGLHGAGLVVLVWSVQRRRVSWADAFGMRWREMIRRTGQGVLCYLGILPVVFVMSLAYQLILFGFGYPLSLQNVVMFFMEPQSLGVRIFLLVLALGIAPLMEEALFRGIALPLLARSLGVIPAILLTAIGFALIHFHVPSLVPLFTLATGFAVAYIITKSLWVPVVMHALFNGMNIGLLWLVTAR